MKMQDSFKSCVIKKPVNFIMYIVSANPRVQRGCCGGRRRGQCHGRNVDALRHRQGEGSKVMRQTTRGLKYVIYHGLK